MAEQNGNGTGRPQINWQTAFIVLITWVASALLAYGAMDGRLRVLEDRYERVYTDIDQIKRDIRVLLERR